MSTTASKWPALPLEPWQETYLSLHLWTQIIGKIKLQLTPLVNHWWNTALQLNSSGLTTGLIHCGEGCLQISFDFNTHKLIMETDDGRIQQIDLKTRSVADFYRETVVKLSKLGIEVKIWTQPVEMEYKVHFEKDDKIREYMPEYVQGFRKVLMETDSVMQQFRSRFKGKTSGVNFWWGSFDLALTFFSGRPAPEHPGSPNVGRAVMIEAYSGECSSVGFWPGAGLGEAAYYAYSYPAPEGYKDWPVKPAEAHYSSELGEFLMPYTRMRATADPAATLLAFFDSTYRAAETTGKWEKGLYKE